MKTTRRLLSLLLAVVLVVSLSSLTAFAAASFTVAVTDASGKTSGDLYKNGTATLTAAVTPANTTGVQYTWSSNRTDVARVAGSGATATVTALGVGTATITVTAEKGSEYTSATYTVSVVEVYPVAIQAESPIQVAVGGKATLQISGYSPSFATDTSVTWAVTEGKNYVTLSGDTVTGKAVGTAILTATAKGENPATTTVLVEVVSGITVTLNANDGTANPATKTVTGTANSNIALPLNTFTREGYTLIGWSEDPLAEKPTYTTSGRFTAAETTLYAVWSRASGASKTVTVSAGETVTVTKADILALKPASVTGTPTSITFTGVPNTYGTLRVNGSALTSGTRTITNLNSFTGITFAAVSNITSAQNVEVKYTVTCDNNTSYDGVITFAVNPTTRTVTFTTDLSTPVALTSAAFNASGALPAAGYTLTTVRFTSLPAAARGTLYMNYGLGASQSAVAANTTYTAAQVNDITFVPASGLTEAVTLSIPYTAVYGRTGQENLTVSGTLRIVIQEIPVVAYTTAVNTAVNLNTEDFKQALFASTSSSYRFTYLSFDLAARGAYTYGALSCTKAGALTVSGAMATLSDGAALDAVSFTPNAQAVSGTTVDIPFTAYYTAGGSDTSRTATGVLRINVGTSNRVSLSTPRHTPLALTVGPFNAEGAVPAAGYTLDYLSFTALPAASTEGTLYYEYVAATGAGTAVTTGTPYYAAPGSPVLNDLTKVTFVPADNASNGTNVIIPYTAVYANTAGQMLAVNGTMTITVGTAQTVQISYTPAASANTQSFSASDFQKALRAALGVDTATLDYVTFTLPTRGTLYYRAAEGETPVAVKATDRFYYSPAAGQYGISGVYLSYQGFVPTVVTFSGVDTLGRTFTATAKVTPKTYFDTPRATYTSGQFSDVSENSWYGANQQGTVRSVVEMGLMQGYENGTFQPTGNITLAEAITMAARLHSIYTGGTGEFTQASGGQWYKVYVDYCVEKGIIKAADFTDYNAKATRAQMAYIFANAVPAYELVAVRDITVPDVKRTDTYGAEIYRLYNAGVLTGYVFTPGYADGAFAPASNITRAEAATIIARIAKPSQRVSG